MFKFSSKVKYSSLILLLAVVVMFYSTALPFSAAVEPEYEYVPITLSIDEIASLVNTYAPLSYYSGSFNNSSFVLYTNQMSIVQEGVSEFLGNNLLYFNPYLDYQNNTIYFYPNNLNGAFTIETGDSVYFEMNLYIPFDYYIGPETEFNVGTYFQSVLSGVIGAGLDVTLLYDYGNHFGTGIYGTSIGGHIISPIVSDPLASRVLDDILPTDIYNSRDVCRYNFSFVYDEQFYDSGYVGGIPSVYEGVFDEVLLNFSIFFNFSDFELDAEVFFPCLFLKPFTIYVKQEIAPTVEKFLSAITDPSPESKAEVERLEQELEEISEQLREDASDLEVEKPDVSDSVEDLPSEVVDGMDEVGQTVLSPLMTLDLIATLFSVLFGVVALKLILFGSGTS